MEFKIPRKKKETRYVRRVEKSVKSQAERIIDKFGGVKNLLYALERIGRPKHPSRLYRWTYPKERNGTSGVIPPEALADIISAARIDGIYLTPEDLDPRPREMVRKVMVKAQDVV